MSDLRQRIVDAAKDMQMVNFATLTEEGKPWVRYVMGKADNELVFRFCTHLESRKVAQIKKNPNAHISLGVSDLETARNWLQVEGVAEISTDKAERDAFWFDDLKNYFSGPDDPGYCIVIVKPSKIEFGTMGSMVPEVWEQGG